MKKSRPTPFVVDKDDRLLVRADAVMHPLIPFVDGLAVTVFKGDGHVYLDVDAAIAWCKNEAQYHTKDKYQVMIEVMERAKAQAQQDKDTPNGHGH